MIVAVSIFHFGRQTRLSTHKDKREFETQVARLLRINACVQPISRTIRPY